MSRASLSACGAWKITGTPWRTHIFTPAELEQWVATVRRRAFATSITAASSRSVITVTDSPRTVVRTLLDSRKRLGTAKVGF